MQGAGMSEHAAQDSRLQHTTPSGRKNTATTEAFSGFQVWRTPSGGAHPPLGAGCLGIMCGCCWPVLVSQLFLQCAVWCPTAFLATCCLMCACVVKNCYTPYHHKHGCPHHVTATTASEQTTTAFRLLMQEKLEKLGGICRGLAQFYTAGTGHRRMCPGQQAHTRCTVEALIPQ